MDAFDKEDLITDEEDRRRLAKMTEFEREMELADRAEARQQQLQRQQLLAASGGDADEDGRKPKRQGAARRSGREVREETAKKSAIEELKAARERKAQGRKAHDARDLDVVEDFEEEEDLGDGRGYDDDSDLEEGEADEGPGGRRWAPRDRDDEADIEQEEASPEDLKSIQVRRHKLEEWITKPHFEVSLPGSMVRVAAGDKRGPDGSVAMDERGRPQVRYMLVQVISVEELPPGVHKYLEGGSGWKSPYPFGPDGAKTSKWLKVSRGKSERVWPLAQVSNAPFTDDEFSSWQHSCEGNRDQVTRGDVLEVLERLNAADSYVYSAEDVARMLEEKRAKGQMSKNVASERARLERERDAAIEMGDEVRIAEVQGEIEALEAAAAAAVSSRQVIAASMAMLNKKNTDRNFQTAFKAGKGGAGGGPGAAGTLDPFSRRATRTKNYWNTQRRLDDALEGGEEATALMEVELADAAAAAAAEAAAAAASSVPELTLVDLSELDLSLLDMPMKIAPIARKLLGSRGAMLNGGAGAGAVNGGRATLSLAEYKQRNGLAR